jgi:hypothetical protein
MWQKADSIACSSRYNPLREDDGFEGGGKRTIALLRVPEIRYVIAFMRR